MPFCQPAEALASVGPTRRILLLRGTDAFGAVNVGPNFPGIAGGVISIIGQPGAAIAPGAFVGVTVGGGDVYLRGLTIRDGEKEGVVADGAATVRLNQCVIRLNKKGGLRFQNGAGFDVTNTILDGNGVGFLNGVTPFGGAYLGAPEAGRPGVFRFNTVIRNGMVGVACGRPWDSCWTACCCPKMAPTSNSTARPSTPSSRGRRTLPASTRPAPTG